MTTPKERQRALAEVLEQRVLVLDGAMGTLLQQHHLTAADFGGPALEGCNENLVRTRPDVVLGIHRAYFAAGADMVETDTFGATPLVLAEYGIEPDAHELNRLAAQLARQAAAEFSTTAKPRFVAGSIGPTTKAISVVGGVTFPQLIDAYLVQAKGLIAGGADVLLVETCNDTRTVKAALIAIERARAELASAIPIMVSGTIETIGTMLAGQTADAFCASLLHADLLSLGLNCGTGPEFMTDHLRTIADMAPFRVSCYPNAGLPNEEGRYLETPDAMAAQLDRFLRNGWLNMVGGCCGTTDAHIHAIAQMAESHRPRPLPAPAASSLVFRHRAGGSRREQPPADRRRAHQRHRLAPLQEYGGRREMGGSHRDRAPPGQERCAHRRRLPAERRPR